MDDKPETSAAATKPTALHPTYSVTNIQSKIRTLDGSTVTYSSWVQLFQLHVVAYKVVDHIDNNILPQILPNTTSAKQSWDKLEKIYLSNKKAQAAALETRFCNLSLSACASLDDYCQQLLNLATQLADVHHPVTDARLVLQLVRGLPAEYNTTASFINNKEADWDLAISLLQDEAIRIEAQKGTTSSVMVAANSNSNSSPQPALTTTSSDHPNESNTSSQSRGRGRGCGRNNYRGGGRRDNRGGGAGRSFWTAGNPSAYNSPYPN
ncbi:uncharacterized protein LOC110944311 [Helianthus annuus]|uniref:uncharacterized protein LOC110944311 n=1 Tax=Helianthus annuus TaxID=4232 RepID=UPI000B8F2109|nr:uncharacterized protein LOC110944311 [Helianthus annuus]